MRAGLLLAAAMLVVALAALVTAPVTAAPTIDEAAPSQEQTEEPAQPQDDDEAEPVPGGDEATDEATEETTGEEPAAEGATGDDGTEQETNGGVPWNILGIAALFGAFGGVIYELIALQGNIEWPHRPDVSEMPKQGFPYAKAGSLFDLGILARILIGAGAAISVLWLLPLELGRQLVAVSLVAGSAGIAIFRSLQDRLLAALNEAKLEGVGEGLVSLDADMQKLMQSAELPSADLSAEARTAQTQMQQKAAEIQGRVKALRELAGRG